MCFTGVNLTKDLGEEWPGNRMACRNADQSLGQTHSSQFPPTQTTKDSNSQESFIMKEEVKEFDCIIVGAGPAGLACLSGIQEPYSLDTGLSAGQLRYVNRHCTSRCRSVAVIDPHPDWMTGWSKHFANLNIQFLRSPCMAHPDLFDKNALLAYAEMHGRQNELIESGCADELLASRTLYESQVGLWKLPSTSLFADFCKDMSRRLPHTYVQGEVTDIDREEDDGPLWEVTMRDGTKIRAADVILGMGTIGQPIVPAALADAPNLVQWTSLGNDNNILLKQPTCRNVLVVGGGLTAVQVVQRVVRDNPKARVTLCCRRPLQERHFDLSIDWFNLRTANKCMFDFYHQSEEDRLSTLKDTRDGGSVPGLYMNDLRRMERAGQVVRVVGNASFLRSSDDKQATIAFDGRTVDTFDAIVLACGTKPDCTSNHLCKKLLERWPLKVVDGFPCVSEDLVWTKNLYVIGSLGSLNIGPDAANLMGIRRGAEIIANAMECRCWLRQESVLKNPFCALEETSSDDSSDDEE